MSSLNSKFCSELCGAVVVVVEDHGRSHPSSRGGEGAEEDEPQETTRIHEVVSKGI